MKNQRTDSAELRAFDRAEKMRAKIRRRALDAAGRKQEAPPALMKRIARADRRLAEARARVEGVDRP